MRLFARRSKNFTVPRPLRHFLYMRQRRTRDGGTKKILFRKVSAIAFKGGKKLSCLDHVIGGHRPTGLLSPVPGLHDTARKSLQPKPVRFGHSGPILTPHCKEDKA